MLRYPLTEGLCPNCGSPDRLTEPAMDEEGLPTGRTVVTCAACGRHLGWLPPVDVEGEDGPLELNEPITEGEEADVIPANPDS